MKSAIRTSAKLTGAIGFMIVILVAGCQRPPQEKHARTVLTAQIGTAQSDGFRLHGWIKPKIESRLGFQVSGKMQHRLIDVGDTVDAGQTIATLDAADLILAHDTLKAQAVSARATHQLAQSELDRTRTLFERGIVGHAVLTQRESEADVSRAALEASLKQADAAALAVTHTRLVSETAGIVTAIFAEAGEVLAAGSPVAAIASLKEKEVELLVAAPHLNQVAVDATVDVELPESKQKLTGVVREHAPSADPALGAYRVRISLPSAPDEILFGTKATILADTKKTGFEVPVGSIVAENAGDDSAVIWQVDRQNKAHARPVDIEFIDENQALVLGDLDPSLPVVAIGAHLLSEGEEVRAVDRSLRALNAEAAP